MNSIGITLQDILDDNEIKIVQKCGMIQVRSPKLDYPFFADIKSRLSPDTTPVRDSRGLLKPIKIPLPIR